MIPSSITTAAPSERDDVTEQQLWLAYRELSRPGWPTFEQCLADHVRRTCLAGIARNRGRAAWQATPAAPGLPRGPAVPPTPTVEPVTVRAARARAQAAERAHLPVWKTRGIDLKRAAANDRDD